jgi:hypothetical protein
VRERLLKSSKWLTILGRRRFCSVVVTEEGHWMLRDREEGEEDIAKELPEDFNFLLAMCSQKRNVKN